MTGAGTAQWCALLLFFLFLTNLLFIGDIFGSPGRGMVARHLPGIVAAEKIDLTIANGENAAGGFGITPQLADELFGYGLDVITTGNHVWDKREIYDYFARQPRLLRPAKLRGRAAWEGRGGRAGA